MADTITATLHYGEKAITLVKSIADYGHYMKPFIQAYGTGAGSDNQIACYNAYSDGDIETVKTAVAANAFAKSGAVDEVGITYTLALGSETTIYFYVKPNEGYGITKADQIVVKKGGTTVGNATVSWDEAKGRYTVVISNINAAQRGDTYTIEIRMNDGNTVTAKASVRCLTRMPS